MVEQIGQLMLDLAEREKGIADQTEWLEELPVNRYLYVISTNNAEIRLFYI